MKKYISDFFGVALIVALIAVTAFVACEKPTDTLPSNVEQVARKKKPTVDPNASIDSLYAACNMVRTDSSLVVPTIILTNLRTSHRTGVINGVATDILVIEFDPAVVSGKTVSGYVLRADQCTGRPGCGSFNGLVCAQVTYSTTLNKFEIPAGLSWLNPWNPQYTGLITISFTDNCMRASQTFQFTPPTL
jgi:hypothetical protein